LFAGTTWNAADKDADVSLSNSDHTAMVSSGGGYRGIRGTAGKTSGKYYFEVTETGSVDANMIVGIGSAKGDLARYLGFTDHSGGLDGSGTVAGLGGGSDGNPAIGDVISIAVDADRKMVWF